MESLIAQAKALPDVEKLAIGQWLSGALPLTPAPEPETAAAPAPAPVRPKLYGRGAAGEAVYDPANLPHGGGWLGIPTAEDYRAWRYDDLLCMGRRITVKDVRWLPQVMGEGQCTRKPADGDDLCPTCRRNFEKYAEKPKAGATWLGRINEEPPGWLHMLGTAWAEHKQPKWVGPK